MRSAETLTEARRILTVCNACGYCNGFCDLFTAAARRRGLTDGDLEHLAHLCHGCRNCLYACQYAAPHPFAVNVPSALAGLRQATYAARVWPAWFAQALTHPLRTALLVSLVLTALLSGALLASLPSEVIFARHLGPGAFYRVIPWWLMALLGALPLGWSLLAYGVGLSRYSRATSGSSEPGAAPGVATATLLDVLRLRNLQGGGPGCAEDADAVSHRRRWLHQSMLFGFIACLAATLVATLYHHLLGREAPYPLTSLPVVLGTLGGLAMAVGAAGLVWIERRADPAATTPTTRRADLALLGATFAVAASGLLLLAARATPAMGLLLAVHLGLVAAFFLLLPYGKLAHAGYRVLALWREAGERRARQRSAPPDTNH